MVIKIQPYNIVIAVPGLHFILGKVIGKKSVFYTGIAASITKAATPDMACFIKIQGHDIITANAERI
jgi:hypothetical protein